MSTGQHQRVTDLRVVVAGGTGAVGTGVVAALLAEGAHVGVPGRDAARLDDLRGRVGDHPRLVTVVGDLADPGTGPDLASALVDRLGGLDAGVASVGGWWSGPPLRELERSELDRVLASGLGAHHGIAAALLPHLDDVAGATHVLVNGAGGLHPVPGSGAVSVSAAAQLMLARALAAEQPAGGAVVRSLVLATPVITHTRPSGPASWLTADHVGSYVCHMLADPAAHDEVVVVLASPEQVEDARVGRG